MWWLAGSNCLDSKTLRQYANPFTFVRGSTKTKPMHPSLETATDTVTLLLNVSRVRSSNIHNIKPLVGCNRRIPMTCSSAGAHTRRSFCKFTGVATVNYFFRKEVEVVRVRWIFVQQFDAVNSCVRRFFRQFSQRSCTGLWDMSIFLWIWHALPIGGFCF